MFWLKSLFLLAFLARFCFYQTFYHIYIHKGVIFFLGFCESIFSLAFSEDLIWWYDHYDKARTMQVTSLCVGFCRALSSCCQLYLPDFHCNEFDLVEIIILTPAEFISPVLSVNFSTESQQISSPLILKMFL